MAASSNDQLHQFVEGDDTPSYTAERIVELADGRRTVGEIAAVIAEEFEGAALPEVQSDVSAFIGTLVERQVLVLHSHPVS
jgi:pyrroloquinoline quinone biosynthesis protein D